MANRIRTRFAVNGDSYYSHVATRREVQLLRSEKFDQAPEGPGIYAWYIDIRATRPHLAKNNPRAFLQDLRRKHDFIDPTTKIFLKSPSEHFGTYWSAQVKISSPFARNPLWANEEDDNPQHPEAWASEDDGEEVSDVPEIAANQSEELARFLLDTFPYFSSPVYIGTSKNLRGRLNEHRNAFLDLLVAENRYLDALESGQSWRRFAGRCFLHGLKIDDLIVVCHPLGSGPDATGNEKFRRARLLGERFLNLMSRPLFGMR